MAAKSKCASLTFLPKNVQPAVNDTFSRKRLRKWIAPSSKSTVCDAAGEPLDLERHRR